MRGLLHSNKLPLKPTLVAEEKELDLANPELREEAAAHLTGVCAGVTEGEGVVAREEAEVVAPMRSLEANLRWARTARAAASAGVSASGSGSRREEEQSLPVGDEGVESTSKESLKRDDEMGEDEGSRTALCKEEVEEERRRSDNN